MEGVGGHFMSQVLKLTHYTNEEIQAQGGYLAFPRSHSY